MTTVPSSTACPPRETEIVNLVVFDKLGLTDRVALTRYAIRRGLIEP